MIRKIFITSLAAALILSGCNLSSGGTPTALVNADTVMTAAAETAIASFTQAAAQSFTATAPATPSLTPNPPTLAPTATEVVVFEPIDATCHYPATVRSWPGKGGEDLGYVRFNQGVKVVARNNIGNWLYIPWADSPSGFGWVSSQAFDLTTEVGILPIALEVGDKIVMRNPVKWEIKGTPLPLPTLPNDPTIRPATVIQAATIRVCPTKFCQPLGYLPLGATIIMTGRYGDNEWAQFLFPSGPGGKGWVIREVIQPSAESFGGLPYYDVLGEEITPEPETNTPDPNISPTPTYTPTIVPLKTVAIITDTTTLYTLMSSFSPELGKLNAKDKIYITAASFNKLWYEIQYPPNTGGRAYISTKYVRLTGDFRNLPYTDSLGTPFPTVPPVLTP